MKKIVTILLGVMLISFGVGILSLNHYGFNIENMRRLNVDLNRMDIKDSKITKKNIYEEKYEEITNIKNISVETPFVDVRIIPEEREDIKIDFKGYIKANYIPKLKTERKSNTLYVSIKKDNKHSYAVRNSSIKLYLYIPEDYKDKISITTSSGDIEASKLNLSSLDVTANSGDVKILDLVSDSLSVKTSSGKQELSNIQTKDNNFEANSGSIEIYNLIDDVNVVTSSGDIRLSYKNFDNNINVAANSGNIKIELPRDSQFNLEAHTSSGDIESNFSITISGKQRNNLSGKVGNSNNYINVITSSGDIKIKTK